ncbi:tetratricopeptide repeat protein [Desulfogranum mediterraneum]|uniref:tetratricopeptide repeat protein n=1 Tax=Desulfogranum mediterraneum TaxID=160661 RepID=UPI0004091B0E|nr:tetratricopeptide repeat protein [Desulfogranum mediterraneum]
MNLVHKFRQQSGLVKVLFATLSVVVLILISAVIYYDRINSAEDPRVLEARTMLRQYEKGLESDDYGTAISLLRGMELIYAQIPGYADSFELGVIFNNMASVYLVKLETELLSGHEVERSQMLATLATAEGYSRQAIALYEGWLARMGSLSRPEVEALVRPDFPGDDPQLIEVDLERVIAKRVDDILMAQLETRRRLSVSYANLGVVLRYKGELEAAKKAYQTALQLWDRNYTAEDNLKILQGLPPGKRSMLSRLFPPERSEDQKQ